MLKFKWGMRKTLVLLIGLVLFQSCISNKKVTYFQDAKPSFSSNDTSASAKSADSGSTNKLKIQPYDVLDIRVNPSTSSLDILTKSQLAEFIPGTKIGGDYFTGFLVDAEGNVNLPQTGKIHLAGLTISQAKDVVSKKMGEYLNDPYVEIKFLTFRVTVLGEVKEPGEIIIPNEKANLLEALSRSGDRTDYGNSKEITILRGDLTNNPIVYKIDLTQMSALNSAGFILMPNDVIYVKALKRKVLVLNTSQIVVFAAILNTLTLLLTRI